MKRIQLNTLLSISSFILLLAFILEKPINIFKALHNIILQPDLVLVDYFAIGGVSATLVNVSVVTFISIFLVYKTKSNFSGPIVAGLFTIMGFAFMGKNIFNILPLYFGGYMYARKHKEDSQATIVAVLFSTTLAPVVSLLAFGLGINLGLSLPLALIFGFIIGYFVRPISLQMIKFHEGYNLYNIGFTGGIIGTIITSSLRAIGFNIEMQLLLSHEYSNYIRDGLLFMSLVFIFIGFILNNRSFNGYRRLFKHSGKLITDFIELLGDGIVYINMGLMGIISILYVILVGGDFNGPVIAGVLTVVGFSAFGKHPLNSIPIILGVYLVSHITVFDASSTTLVIAALFGTTLAPISGRFGFLAGILAGGFHLFIVTNIGRVHGGINLYNNGFAGGIGASILLPILRNIYYIKIDSTDV